MKYHFNGRGPGKTTAFNLERAYREYAALPMPQLNKNHLYDRSRYQLEEEAIRGQVAWIARKYGVTFMALDKLIELRSEELFNTNRI